MTGVQLSDLPQLSCRKLYTPQGKGQGQSASPPHQVPSGKTRILFLQETSKRFQACLKDFGGGCMGILLHFSLQQHGQPDIHLPSPLCLTSG